MKSVFLPLIIGLLMFGWIGCVPESPPGDTDPDRPILEDVVERLDDRLDAILDASEPLEQLAEGFEWAEGPVWWAEKSAVLFTDIPRNTIYQWSEAEDLDVFLRPAGFNGDDPYGFELGANGLMFDHDGELMMCNHGLRSVTRLNQENFTHSVIASHYDGKRLNSPNDLALKSNGDLYFTDPSYGLEGINNSPHKELDYNGVYRVTPEGDVTLLSQDFTNPNGIAFSPDESVLYVAQSDGQQPILRSYDVQEDGLLADGRIFFDASALRDAGRRGAPDGMAVDQDGNVWATGPGGVMIIAPDGTHLGSILTGQATANCTFGGEDGSVLYVTADMFLYRIQTKTKGAGF